MSVWIRNLQIALTHKSVILLHGNVRDRYIDEDGRLYENLTQLLRFLATTLHEQSDIRFSEMLLLDPICGERRCSIGKGNAPATDTKMDRGDASAEDLDPEKVLARWASELGTASQPGSFAVVNYLDKLVSQKPTYQNSEQRCLLWIEKLIENIDPAHRLVLIALEDSMFPYELYTYSPKCRVLKVPAPDNDDREKYLRSSRTEDSRLELISQLTDGMFLRELDPIASDLQRRGKLADLKLRSVINLHRVGVEEDHWSKISLDKLVNALKWFVEGKGVKGQNEVLERIMDALLIARAGLSGLASGTSAKPRGVFFFAGPTGVGKTFIAKKLAEFLFGNEEAFIRLDMSEFKEEHTISRLLGSPPGYIGSERGGMLTNAVRERPFAVVLFDEIEKANPRIMDLFLQILDEGRLTDSRGQTVFFTETLIILTSNVGNRTTTYGNVNITDLESGMLDEIKTRYLQDDPARAQSIRDHFVRCAERFFREELSRPELLGRLGNNIIPFNLLDDRETQLSIVREHIKRITDDVEKRISAGGNHVIINPSVAEFLADAHSDVWAERGARGITDTIGVELVTRLAEFVLSIESNNSRDLTLRIEAKDGTLEARAE